MTSGRTNSDVPTRPAPARTALEPDVALAEGVARRDSRAARVLVILIALCGALLAAYHGEFWPLSVYPMFSAAGRPWQRALVRVMPGERAKSDLQREYVLDEVPGRPLPLRGLVPQDDLSSLVQRAERWSQAETDAVIGMFGALPCSAPLLVLRVRGALAEGRVRELAEPVAWLGCSRDAVYLQRLRESPPPPAPQARATLPVRGSR